jgi:hypothetical protein
MKRIAIILMFVASLIILTACEKDKDPEFMTVKRKLPVEGEYKGEIKLQCDSIHFNKTYPVTIMISSFSSEMLCIKSLFVATAYPSVQSSYHYSEASWIDITDCGQQASYEFSGTGQIHQDSLKERGTFIVYLSGKRFTGKWLSNSIKVK